MEGPCRTNIAIRSLRLYDGAAATKSELVLGTSFIPRPQDGSKSRCVYVPPNCPDSAPPTAAPQLLSLHLLRPPPPPSQHHVDLRRVMIRTPSTCSLETYLPLYAAPGPPIVYHVHAIPIVTTPTATYLPRSASGTAARVVPSGRTHASNVSSLAPYDSHLRRERSGSTRGRVSTLASANLVKRAGHLGRLG